MENQSGFRAHSKWHASSARASLNINTALAMLDTFRERALKAEYELRKFKRSIARWLPKDGMLKVNPTNPALCTITVTLTLEECEVEDAVSILEKLGCPSEKLDLAVL